MANGDNGANRIRASLPNLLVATTYALNKSNSKRAIVGLDYVGGLYKPVVKLCSSGSPAKYVTLDAHTWELVLDQMEVMSAFFGNTYAFYGTFGSPSRIFLQNLDIIYKSSYGAKSICFEERPANMMTPVMRAEPHPPTGEMSQFPSSNGGSGNGNAGDVNDTGSYGNGTTGGGGGGSCEPPSCKKRRYETPPSVTIQEPTFLGLNDVRQCIIERMNYLGEISSLVNRMADSIIIYLHKKIISEDAERVNNILKDIVVFKQFFMSNYADIHANVRKVVGTPNFKDQTINIIIVELSAYGLPWIMKHVSDLVLKS